MSRVLRALLAVLAGIWIGGSMFLEVAVTLPPDACRAPFDTYAFTWPLWKVAPMPALVWSQDRAFDYCAWRYGK